MKFILTIMMILIAGSAVLPQTTPTEPQRYTYHIRGDVKDERSRRMPGISVCLVPAVRPINGRIPCTKTDDAGDYSLKVKDIPDKYRVCASTTDTPFIFEGDKDKSHRVICTDVMVFGAKDESRKVALKFRPQ
ncbi:MAG TPA: hypothetical protein VF791_09570 [Pyrinomonadaceae bacterium]